MSEQRGLRISESDLLPGLIAERITINPDQCGGRPCIRGMRIRVIDVLELLAVGLDVQQVLEELPDLEERDIQATLLQAGEKLVAIGRKKSQD